MTLPNISETILTRITVLMAQGITDTTELYRRSGLTAGEFVLAMEELAVRGKIEPIGAGWYRLTGKEETA